MGPSSTSRYCAGTVHRFHLLPVPAVHRELFIIPAGPSVINVFQRSALNVLLKSLLPSVPPAPLGRSLRCARRITILHHRRRKQSY